MKIKRKINEEKKLTETETLILFYLFFLHPPVALCHQWPLSENMLLNLRDHCRRSSVAFNLSTAIMSTSLIITIQVEQP